MTPPKKRGRPAKVKEPLVTKKDVTDFVDQIVDGLEPPVTSTEDRYTIEVRVNGAVITNVGSTMLEALQGLRVPTKIVTKGTIKVFHNDKSKEIFYMPVQMRRIFYPLAQVTVAKMLAMNL